MAAARAWFEKLDVTERIALLTLAAIGAGLLLFVAGIQTGQALAAIF